MSSCPATRRLTTSLRQAMKQDEMNKISGNITGLSLKGRTVVIRESCLSPEHRKGDRRFLCQNGFGTDPHHTAKPIIGVFRGESASTFDRNDIEGLAAHPLKEKTVA